jgi:hypothetical protein
MAKATKYTIEDLVTLKVEEVAQLVVTLQADLDKANADIQSASKLSKILEKENASLKATVAKPEAAAPKAIIPADEFTCTPKGETEPQTYVFALAKFRYRNQDITAIDALTDTDLLQALVDCGSGAIKVKN